MNKTWLIVKSFFGKVVEFMFSLANLDAIQYILYTHVSCQLRRIVLQLCRIGRSVGDGSASCLSVSLLPYVIDTLTDRVVTDATFYVDL